MATAADFAEEFVRKAKAGERPRMRVQKKYAAALLGELVRCGLRLADECLEHVKDPELREIIKTVLVSAAAGAVLGAAIGAATGPQGAKAGAVVGAGMGMVAAMFAISVRYHEEPGASGPELILEAA